MSYFGVAKLYRFRTVPTLYLHRIQIWMKYLLTGDVNNLQNVIVMSSTEDDQMTRPHSSWPHLYASTRTSQTMSLPICESNKQVFFNDMTMFELQKALQNVLKRNKWQKQPAEFSHVMAKLKIHFCFNSQITNQIKVLLEQWMKQQAIRQKEARPLVSLECEKISDVSRQIVWAMSYKSHGALWWGHEVFFVFHLYHPVSQIRCVCILCRKLLDHHFVDRVHFCS